MSESEQNPNAKGLSIGIIMDGNGRWAKERGLPRVAGHKKGADVFDDITHYATDLEVAALTYYAFSTENWARSKKEIEVIMGLISLCLDKLDLLKNGNHRFTFLGDRSSLSKRICGMMDYLEEKTKDCTGMILSVAVNYGGRQEIIRATQELARDAVAGRLAPDAIDEAAISSRLYTRAQPDPDFILRTSGEKRLSNFLLWQSAYSEMVYTDINWPDFTRADFDAAVGEYRRRSRRFGGEGGS